MWEEGTAAQQAALTEVVRSAELQTRELFASLRRDVASLQQAISAFDTFHTEFHAKMKETGTTTLEALQQQIAEEEAIRKDHFEKIASAIHNVCSKYIVLCFSICCFLCYYRWPRRFSLE